jgi:hypothetical protein
MEKKIVSVDFIKSASVAAGAAVLAACAPQTIEVVKTVEVEKEVKVVETVEVIIEGETVVVTATPAPTEPPETAFMDVWFNTSIPDLSVEWTSDPENEEFKKQWYFGGLGRAIFVPWLEAHPGVSMNITTHSWDWDLRQNQLMALAAGIYPDTTYGEAYVNEFVQLGVYSPLSQKSPICSQKVPTPDPWWTARSTAWRNFWCGCTVHQLDAVGKGRSQPRCCPPPGKSWSQPARRSPRSTPVKMG